MIKITEGWRYPPPPPPECYGINIQIIFLGHLPENVQTEYDAGGLWDVDTVDVIRNFRQTELG